MDWEGLLKLFGAFGVFAAAVTWLAKAVIGRALDAGVAIHRARLERENAQAIERRRADLATTAHEAQARSTVLVTRQAEVVAEIYKRLIDAEAQCSMLMSPVQWGSEPSRAESAPATVDAIKNFIDYFDRHRIFLGEAETAPLDEIREHLRKAWLNFRMFGIEDRNDGLQRERFEKQQEAWKIISDLVPKARRTLEAAFGRMLGVDAQLSRLPLAVYARHPRRAALGSRSSGAGLGRCKRAGHAQLMARGRSSGRAAPCRTGRRLPPS